MIRVEAPGLLTSIQDMGRFGYQHLGVPVSGCMDMRSARKANLILGNQPSDAVIEVTMMGPVLRFLKPAVICICGADLSALIDGVKVSMNRAVEVPVNARLSFGKPINGVRSYIAISGGIQSEAVLKSRSQYTGITTLSKIEKGMNLSVTATISNSQSNATPTEIDLNFEEAHCLKTSSGPEFHLLDDRQKKNLLESYFTVSVKNNRMAYQLEELLINSLPPIITSAVLPGTVQLTPSGHLIILMRDGQTTGGYPRILQLHPNAIDLLSQKKMGDKVTFNLIENIS